MLVLGVRCYEKISLSRAEQSSDQSTATTAKLAIDKDDNTQSITAQEYNPSWSAYFDWYFKVGSLC